MNLSTNLNDLIRNFLKEHNLELFQMFQADAIGADVIRFEVRKAGHPEVYKFGVSRSECWGSEDAIYCAVMKELRNAVKVFEKGKADV